MTYWALNVVFLVPVAVLVIAALIVRRTPRWPAVALTAAVVLVMTAIMGFMCILMGLLAELLTRTYHESQDKPVYLVKETRNLEPALGSGPEHALVE